jgi:hypothetical protein
LYSVVHACGLLNGSPCENPGVAWLERIDARNQRRMEGLQAKHDARAERPDAEDEAAVAVGSYLSFVPSFIGLIGVLLVLVGTSRQHRRKHRE